MTKTEHYHLNQWDAADPVRREDFNADNAALDAALAGLQEAVTAEAAARATAIGALIVTGTYAGNGSSTDTQTITLGFQPRFLFVRDTTYKGGSSSSDNWTPQILGYATPEYGHWVYNQYQVLKITQNGFIAGGVNALFNNKNSTYAYLAIR